MTATRSSNKQVSTYDSNYILQQTSQCQLWQQLDPPTNKSVSVMTATRSSNKQVSVSYDSN